MKTLVKKCLLAAFAAVLLLLVHSVQQNLSNVNALREQGESSLQEMMPKVEQEQKKDPRGDSATTADSTKLVTNSRN